MSKSVPAPDTNLSNEAHSQALADYSALLAQARALPPGSDVEGFMETRLRALALSTRAAVANHRAQDQAAIASQPEAFPPSGLPQVLREHAPRHDAAAPDHDPLGSSDL